MKTLIRFVIAAALFAGIGLVLNAQDAQPEPTKGTVLLLKNGHAMEGDIEKVGSQICIRRGVSEVWIATERTARLCKDWDDAFVYVRSLVKMDDANEVIKLARWCHLNHLNDKALEQARAALELQPMNGDAKQIVMTLERMKNAPQPKPAAPTPVSVPALPETAPTVDVTSGSSIAFATHVQPILMNTCVTCHSTNHTGKFRLDRVHDNSQRAATQRNLAAVMPYIDLERPSISPLLTRAITPHGDVPTPAIRDRSSRPFQILHQWIELTVARNPHLKDYAAAKKNAPSKREPDPIVLTSGFATQGRKEMTTENAGARLSTADAEPRRLPMIAESAPVALPPMPADRYSVDQFNKHFHPNR